MNVHLFDLQVTVISALTEGCSIRAVERLTGVRSRRALGPGGASGPV
jgi:hypothetical protein